MADTAFQTRYREEFVEGFEMRQSLLRASVLADGVANGNSYVFNVIDSGSASAVTRGTNGLIAARADNNTQSTATLAEWHDLVRKTGFNIFASQGNQQRAMQMTSMGVVNRKVDDDIIAQLDTATVDTGSAVKASLDLVVKAQVILGNAFVPIEEEDNLFMLVTPAFAGYMMQVKEFASADYVDVKPFGAAIPRRYRRFGGFNWITHPRLTGVGTSSEKCYAFHRSAIGHGMDMAQLESMVGYNEEQKYSWARTSGIFGSKLLQNTGVVQMLHDGSGYVGS